ncbi:MAG TPA: NUDIX hydrolase [Marmoricola sp.]|nr:NUDIX hydrolase [Marmoricola sp.]
MDPSRRLPDHLVEAARGFADGSRTPVEPKDASTVVLLREGDGGEGGLEVYLLRRTVGMAFAGGFCVFPGGGVDPRDFDHEVGWVGPSPEEWGSLLGSSEEHARALVCAAVRETFEESGVLLAGPTADTVVGDTTGDDWEEDRRALEARELSLTDFLDRRGLKLRTDLLRWWGSWVTPVFEPRRYDTRFFVAVLPEGQVTRDVSSESDHVVWMPVGEIIDAVDDGRLAMLPPTYATCLELYGFTSVASALAAAAERDRTPILPEMQVDDEGGMLRLPERLVALGESVAARRQAARS